MPCRACWWLRHSLFYKTKLTIVGGGKHLVLLLLLLWAGVGLTFGQEQTTELCFNFRVNLTQLDSLYRDNGARMQQLSEALRALNGDPNLRLIRITFCGTASPEGSYELNQRLSRNRSAAVEQLVRSQMALPDSLVHHIYNYIPWDSLREKVVHSDLIDKDSVLAIIDRPARLVPYHLRGEMIDARVPQLQRLQGGRPWRALLKQFFKSMRSATVVLLTYRQEPQPQIEPQPIAPEPLPADTVAMQTDSLQGVTVAGEAITPCPRHLYIKTNAVGWALLAANVAVEADFGCHWSVALPLYWSSWNYFTGTTKFRTLSLQPECRYWLSPERNGLFIAAHAGLTWYNFAFGDSYRTQDHGGHSPAWGGGLAAGWRIPLSHNHRWRMELSLGLGVYRLHHDKFRNEHNGLLVSTERRTRLCFDQAGITLVYAFPWRSEKGGRQ